MIQNLLLIDKNNLIKYYNRIHTVNVIRNKQNIMFIYFY